MVTPPSATDAPTADATGELLPALTRRMAELRHDVDHVEHLHRLSGGASRETWAFDAVDADGGHVRHVLRRDPPTEPGPTTMGDEAVAMRAAHAHGVPGPRLLDSSTDASILGAPYVLVSHVAGESIARRILRDDRFSNARSRLAAQLGDAAARIHSVPVDQIQSLPQADGVELIRERYRATGVERPVFELAFAWLDEHRPVGLATPALVHGDFRLGNIIVDESGLAAVLDWELVHLGDPLEDLGYLCIRAWRFGGPRPVAGVGSFDDLFDAYASVAGRLPDVDRVRWWQVSGTLSWGVSCLVQANRHLSGTTRSVELAAIGRRVAEQELDLLTMISSGAS